jgi:hypothetical protein
MSPGEFSAKTAAKLPVVPLASQSKTSTGLNEDNDNDDFMRLLILILDAQLS